jgi:hypothetical protein
MTCYGETFIFTFYHRDGQEEWRTELARKAACLDFGKCEELNHDLSYGRLWCWSSGFSYHSVTTMNYSKMSAPCSYSPFKPTGYFMYRTV